MASLWSKIAHKDVTGERLQEYPELREFPDHSKRHKAYTSAVKEVARRSRTPIVVRFAFLGGCILSFGLMDYFRFSDRFMKTVAGIALCSYIFLEWRLYRWAIPRVREELRRMLDSTLANCRLCDYSLIGNISGRCPECGTDVPADQQRLISARTELGLEIAGDDGVE